MVSCNHPRFILLYGIMMMPSITWLSSTKASGQKNTQTCKPPSEQFIRAEVKRIIQTDPRKAIWYPEALKEMDQGITLIKGSFSAQNRQEYLAVLRSQFYAGMMSQIDRFDLLLKISCAPNNPNAWKVDWYEQTKAVFKDAVKDIDGDGIDELIIQGGDAKRGIFRYFYQIISIKGNQTQILYKNRLLSYRGTSPTIVHYLPHLDTLEIQPELQFEDVNRDGTNEIVEQIETKVFNGGKTFEAIMKNALKLQQTRVLYLINGKYSERNQDQMIRKAKQYYQLLNQGGHYGQIRCLFASNVQQWLGLKNISKEKVEQEATRFLSTKKNVQYQPDFSLAQINHRTLSVPVKLGWNQYLATVKAYFVFDKRFEIIRLVERPQ